MTLKLITLSQIVRKNNVNPKIARRRLRNAGVAKNVSGWVFLAARRREIARIVRG